MLDFIEALQIFCKYTDKKNARSPFHCEHDVLMVAGIDITSEDDITEDDRDRLKELGFIWSDEYECFISFRYGSC